MGTLAAVGSARADEVALELGPGRPVRQHEPAVRGGVGSSENRVPDCGGGCRADPALHWTGDRLLEEIGEGGSISQAGRALGMSYRRAWLLVDGLNHCFQRPVVRTNPGGWGGSVLTEFGADLVRKYRAIEREAREGPTER